MREAVISGGVEQEDARRLSGSCAGQELLLRTSLRLSLGETKTFSSVTANRRGEKLGFWGEWS